MLQVWVHAGEGAWHPDLHFATSALCPLGRDCDCPIYTGKGHPQGVHPTDCLLSAVCPDEGHPQGVPLPIVFSRRYALGRAPTRGAPTDCLLSAVCPGEGTHKGCPYRLSSLGGMPWGGHPQGVPLPIVFSRRYALGRAPTRGAPNCLLSAVCPYRLSSLGGMPWGGHPQGVPLPIVFSRRPLCPGEGTHKGCPYRLSSLGGMPWGGHPQGAPTSLCPHAPTVFSRRYALKRAPTRGAPTRFRQPHVGLSQFDAIALDTSTVHSLLA